MNRYSSHHPITTSHNPVYLFPLINIIDTLSSTPHLPQGLTPPDNLGRTAHIITPRVQRGAYRPRSAPRHELTRTPALSTNRIRMPLPVPRSELQIGRALPSPGCRIALMSICARYNRATHARRPVYLHHHLPGARPPHWERGVPALPERVHSVRVGVPDTDGWG